MPSPADMPNKISVDCGKYLVRSVTADDASDQWGRWLADAEASHLLNAPRRVMSKTEIASYIATFDQRSHLLLGVFEKTTGKHLGFLRIDVDFALSRFLATLLIGEPDYRNKGVMGEINGPLREFLFETLGFKTALATVLSHNRAVVHYLLKTGWNLDKTIARHVKSHADGSMLDLCFFSLTREAWRAWKKAHPPVAEEKTRASEDSPKP
jgi:RimJ/RimL family protein N-acetyltransferase